MVRRTNKFDAWRVEMFGATFSDGLKCATSFSVYLKVMEILIRCCGESNYLCSEVKGLNAPKGYSKAVWLLSQLNRNLTKI